MRWTEAQLATYQQRREAPLFPAKKRARRAAVRLPVLGEADVHLAVVAHLKARAGRAVHWHHPATGELRDPGTACKLQRMGVKPGLPDFLLLIGGRLHGLELKRERGGRVSPDQITMHAELIAAGAVVATARGLDQALAILDQWGAFSASTGMPGKARYQTAIRCGKDTEA